MYFHKPQEKPRKWGSFQDVQYAVMKNCEKIYGIDPDSIVLAMPLFWGLPALDYSGKSNHGTNHGATYKDGSLNFDGVDDYVDIGTINLADDTAWTVSFWTNPGTLQIEGFIGESAAFGGFIGTNTFGDVIFDSTTGGSVTKYPSIPANNSSLISVICNGTDSNNIEIFAGKTSAGVGTTAVSDFNIEFIGRYQTYQTVYYADTIDEVRISNVAQTADQIALFHALPWALYQPVSRPVYFFQAAVGGLSIPVAMSHYLRQMGA